MFNRTKLILQRELKELRRNKTFFQTMAIMPFILVFLPVGVIILFYQDIGQFILNHNTGLPTDCTALAGVTGCDKAQLIADLLKITYSFFLPVPVILPMTVAAYSLIGEKERKSLEPLLASPVSTNELLLGKALSAIIPPTLICWFSFALLQVIMRWQLPDLVFNLLEIKLWIITILTWTPLQAFVTTMFGIAISARSRDVRAAQQVGSLMGLPILAIVIGISLGFFQMSWGLWLGGIVFLLILCWISYGIALELFQRETILTRWK